MEHFTHNVQEALHSLVGGLELTKPDIKAHEALNVWHDGFIFDGVCDMLAQMAVDAPGPTKG